MSNGKIYVIKNDVNDLVYVGQTIRGVEERFKEHCRKNKAKHEFISSAIQEIGREHFFYEILESGIETQRELNYREAYYVATMRTVWPDGYNRTTGGAWNREFKDTKRPARQEFVDAYKAGYTLSEIADHFGVCGTTVWNHLKKAGVERRSGGCQPGECNRWEHTRRKARTLSDQNQVS